MVTLYGYISVTISVTVAFYVYTVKFTVAFYVWTYKFTVYDYHLRILARTSAHHTVHIMSSTRGSYVQLKLWMYLAGGQTDIFMHLIGVQAMYAVCPVGEPHKLPCSHTESDNKQHRLPKCVVCVMWQRSLPSGYVFFRKA